MRLSLIVIGRMKAGAEQDLFDRYFERAQQTGKQIGLQFAKIVEYPESRLSSADARKEEEADKIFNSLPPHSVLFCLDERGKDVSSVELTRLISRLKDDQEKEITFVIGGPDGLSGRIREKAAHILALGKLTYPHMLARILLMEQLYRTLTIKTGHPYHRE